MKKSSKGKVYNFLRDNVHVTLAVVNAEGKPEAATVKYVLDGDNLIIDITADRYTHYIDLINNSDIACVVTADRSTLQFNAHVHVLSGVLEEEARQKLGEIYPKLADNFTPDSKFFLIEPKWMRLQDFNKRPVEEVYYEPAD